MNPRHFSAALEKTFQTVASGLSGEIRLFRALRDTFIQLSTQFAVEELHGSKSQVRFWGGGKWGRAQDARCELADMLIVAFRRKPDVSIRMTFVQAKLERRIIANSCARQAGFKKPVFDANLEQWDLLGNHRIIDEALGEFKPPKRILRDALLPSIGSYIFFYYDQSANREIYYSSAKNLRPKNPKSLTRYSKLRISKCCEVATTKGFREVIAMCNSRSFAFHLAMNEIGTPIEPGCDLESGGATSQCRVWLAGVLRRIIDESEAADRPTEIANDLLELLGVGTDLNQQHLSGVSSIVLLRTDEHK